ncbi:MAG: hypothetical protein N3D82_03460 [Ignisphaera sp.]|nr:hypothetical protein [Ignisphaera sp.]MCX8168066.1 hypothetical protein [Ignisphaera sp.]MDW8085745.1 hypothetical protein [Ignisphaera sp.]
MDCSDVDLCNRLVEIDRYSVTCPVCSGSAMVVVHSYSDSKGDSTAIVTLKCEHCGFKASDAAPLYEVDDAVCIDVRIERDADLSTILFLPSQVDVEIPKLGVAVEARSIRIGSIVTVDALLHYIADSIEVSCSGELGCGRVVERLRELASGVVSEPVTVYIKSLFSPLKVLRSYREGNYRYC